MTDRKAIKRAINAEGVYFFGGYYLPEDIPTVQALSAKTDETVARIKERANGGKAGKLPRAGAKTRKGTR